MVCDWLASFSQNPSQCVLQRQASSDLFAHLMCQRMHEILVYSLPAVHTHLVPYTMPQCVTLTYRRMGQVFKGSMKTIWRRKPYVTVGSPMHVGC